MRILHLLHQALPDHVGGVELNTHHLAHVQQRSGHQVALAFPRDNRRPLLPVIGENGEQRFALPHAPRSDLARFGATFRQSNLSDEFARVVTIWQPDLVHIQHMMGLPISIIDWLHEAGLPYLITLHDYWWMCANAQLLTNDSATLCSGPDSRWVNCGRCALARAGVPRQALLAAPALSPLFALRTQRLNSALRGAAALTAPTMFTRDQYQALGVADRIEVVPYGIPLPESLPAQPQEDGEQLKVAYLGSIAPQKGVHLLVEALATVPADKIKLDIYGGLDSSPLYAERLQNRSGPNIHWHGRIPNNEVFARLAAADLLVVPSLWYETAVITIQEAFAVGTPVIASRLGAMTERVHDGEDGLLFEANNSAELAGVLRRLIDDPMLLPRLRAGIRSVHTIARQAAQLDRVYRDVIRTGEGIGSR